MIESIIEKHGGYQRLLSYQKAQIVYDATRYFCHRFLRRSDRTYDQMVQVARSGKQNIVEGSQASGTSKKMELKLTSVARASLEELLEDYRDFLRINGIEEWEKNSDMAKSLRQKNRISGAGYSIFQREIESDRLDICANTIIGLIKVTTYLLDRQIASLQTKFIQDGGFSERMTNVRRKNWNRRF